MTSYIGIDISQKSLSVAVLDGTTTRQREFANTLTGFNALWGWLKLPIAAQAWVCLEATSRYGEAVADYLYARGVPVSIVNPHSVHHFAQTLHRHTKTDLSDAAVLARYLPALTPRLWHPPTPAARQLQELVRHLDDLQRAHTRVTNQLASQTYQSTFVRDDLLAQQADLAARMHHTRQQMQAHIDQHPNLRQQRDLLVTIPGIAHDTAARLLGEVLDFARFDSAAALVAFAGLCPRLQQSGTSVHKRSRLSKRGNGAIRHLLYYPALSAIQHNPPIQRLRERLLKSGHSRMQCVAAAMHKLLVLAYGVLKSGQPFDPHWRQFPLTP